MYTESQPKPMGQKETTNLSFSSSLGKLKGACPGTLQDQEKVYIFNTPSRRKCKKHKADTSTEGLRNVRIPSRTDRRYFSPEASQ